MLLSHSCILPSLNCYSSESAFTAMPLPLSCCPGNHCSLRGGWLKWDPHRGAMPLISDRKSVPCGSQYSIERMKVSSRRFHLRHKYLRLIHVNLNLFTNASSPLLRSPPTHTPAHTLRLFWKMITAVSDNSLQNALNIVKQLIQEVCVVFFGGEGVLSEDVIGELGVRRRVGTSPSTTTCWKSSVFPALCPILFKENFSAF